MNDGCQHCMRSYGHASTCPNATQADMIDRDDELLDDDFDDEFVGVEILPGFTTHVSRKVQPETIEALQEMGRLLMEQIERKEKP